MRIKLSNFVTLNNIREIFGVPTEKQDAEITYVCTDTRELVGGDLFVGIEGKNTDGASFTDLANKMGAYTLSTSNLATIKTTSSDEILSKLIIYFKSRLTHLKYTVAITGSVGKTTTKELLFALTKNHFKAHSSHKNFNNLVGLFHTVISAPKDTELLIAELGMNAHGEISKMSRLLSPDLAIITAIGNAHVGMLGSREEIARAKLEICEGLKDSGKTVVPFDEQTLESAKGKITFSMHQNQSNAFFIPLRLDSGGTLFDFYSQGKVLCGCRFSIAGEQNFHCLMGAFTCAILLGVPLRELSSYVSRITPDILRPTFLTIGQHTVYNDSYSSSPEALYETMRMLTLYKKPLSAVIGDMLELGDGSAYYHRSAGKDAARLGFKRLYLIGKHSRHILEGALSGGIKSENIHINNNADDLLTTLDAIDKTYGGEIILVKASHKAGLDRLIKMMMERWT